METTSAELGYLGVEGSVVHDADPVCSIKWKQSRVRVRMSGIDGYNNIQTCRHEKDSLAR